jgi:tRNA pseudouridine55 synthase
MSSTAAVAAVRRASDAAKAGHGGTLDPLASGLLPIALGEATKTVQWAMAGTKTYRLTIRWGESTATDDAEGPVVARSPVRPTERQIRAALPAFTGEIMQVPSRYSAIKLDGRRAYEIARSGETVTLVARPVRIDRIDLLPIEDEDHATLEVRCGKGVYMRSLGRDLARALGTEGHLTFLRRMAVGRLGVANAIPVERLAELGHKQGLSEHLLPVATVLDDIPALALTEAEALLLRYGQSIRPLCPADRARIDQLGDGSMVSVSTGATLVGMARLDAGRLQPVRILTLT